MLSRSTISRVCALAAFGALAFLSLGAAEAKILAKVDGSAITDQDVNVAAKDIGATLPPQLQGPQRQAYILTYLIDLKLVAKKAEAEKLGDGPDFARQMAYYRNKVLMEDLFTKVAKDAATDAAVKQAYDKVAKAQKPQIEIHARHILVQTKAEAEAALKRVKGGEDFAKVADAVSKDSGAHGGDLGWFTKDRMVPAFAAAAFKLKPGEISDPVKTQFGWHIIQVLGKRTKPFPAFAKVQPQVKHFVMQKAQGDLIAQLRKSAKIERFDAPPAPLAPPASPAPAGAAPGATPTPAAPTAGTPAAPAAAPAGQPAAK